MGRVILIMMAGLDLVRERERSAFDFRYSSQLEIWVFMSVGSNDVDIDLVNGDEMGEEQ